MSKLSDLAAGRAELVPPRNICAPRLPYMKWAALPPGTRAAAATLVGWMNTIQATSDLPRPYPASFDGPLVATDEYDEAYSRRAFAQAALVSMRRMIGLVSWALVDARIGRGMSTADTAAFYGEDASYIEARFRRTLSDVEKFIVEM